MDGLGCGSVEWIGWKPTTHLSKLSGRSGDEGRIGEEEKQDKTKGNKHKKEGKVEQFLKGKILMKRGRRRQRMREKELEKEDVVTVMSEGTQAMMVENEANG